MIFFEYTLLNYQIILRFNIYDKNISGKDATIHLSLNFYQPKYTKKEVTMQFTEARNYIEFSEKDRNLFQRVFWGHSLLMFILIFIVNFVYFCLTTGTVRFSNYFIPIIIFFLFTWISNSLFWMGRYIKYLNYIRFVDDRVIISHYHWNKKREEEFSIKDLTLKKAKTGFYRETFPILEFYKRRELVITVESYGGRLTNYWSEEDLDKLYDYFIEYQKKYLEPNS